MHGPTIKAELTLPRAERNPPSAHSAIGVRQKLKSQSLSGMTQITMHKYAIVKCEIMSRRLTVKGDKRNF